MKRPLLFWRLYPYYFAIILISLLLTALYSAHEMRTMYTDEITHALEARARLAGMFLKPMLPDNDAVSLNLKCRELAKLSDTRITLIDSNGIVLGDSDEDPRSMENHASRPEIRQAFAEGAGASTRYSNTLQTTMLYVAVPLVDEGKVVAIVRTAVPVSAIDSTLVSFYRNIIIGGLLVLLLAALVSIVVVRRLTGPLGRLRDGAEGFAEGDLSTRLPVPNTEEIAVVAESMNLMAAQLDARLHTIAQQRNEREAILSSMSEGVLALDAGERIVSINHAAADLLGLDSEEVIGSAIYEVARIPSLQEFVEKALRSPDTIETEISLPGATERSLQAHGTVLHDSSGKRAGVVLVFTDITRLKKLENIRRDFVANVSHELKTPITAITGSTETLLGGALSNPDDSRRFLEMIARHSDRLNNLVDDLLSLARIESETEQNQINLTQSRVIDVLQASIRACQEKSSQHNVNLTCSCEPDLEANINQGQLEQAISNLIHNAIKHSDDGSSVSIEAITSETEIVISVRDSGTGIAAEHHPRLFERFYRVDQARSRQEGGTGLGLAIVKHIALAHGGRVSVDSSLGKGSTFSIFLPALR